MMTWVEQTAMCSSVTEYWLGKSQHGFELDHITVSIDVVEYTVKHGQWIQFKRNSSKTQIKKKTWNSYSIF